MTTQRFWPYKRKTILMSPACTPACVVSRPDLAVAAPERSVGCQGVFDSARLSESMGEPALVPPHVGSFGSRGLCGKLEAVVRRDPGAIPACVGREQLGLGGVEAVRGRHEPDPESNGITFGKSGNRRQGEVAVGIIDLMEELDLVRRSAQSTEELTATGVEPAKARERPDQDTLGFALEMRAVLAAHGTRERVRSRAIRISL